MCGKENESEDDKPPQELFQASGQEETEAALRHVREEEAQDLWGKPNVTPLDNRA